MSWLYSICHFSDHSINLLRSSCKCCLSASLLIFLNTFVSSANFNTLLVMSSSKSLIYIKNKIGPWLMSAGDISQVLWSTLAVNICFMAIDKLHWCQYLTSFIVGQFSQCCLPAVTHTTGVKIIMSRLLSQFMSGNVLSFVGNFYMYLIVFANTF